MMEQASSSSVPSTGAIHGLNGVRAAHRRSPVRVVSSVVAVSGLTRNVESGHINDIFSHFGPVRAVHLSIDPRVNLSRGAAFVEFDRPSSAERALKEMNGGQIDGALVHVSIRPAGMPSQRVLNSFTFTRRSPSPQRPVSPPRTTFAHDDRRRNNQYAYRRSRSRGASPSRTPMRRRTPSPPSRSPSPSPPPRLSPAAPPQPTPMAIPTPDATISASELPPSSPSRPTRTSQSLSPPPRRRRSISRSPPRRRRRSPSLSSSPSISSYSDSSSSDDRRHRKRARRSSYSRRHSRARSPSRSRTPSRSRSRSRSLSPSPRRSRYRKRRR